MNTIVTAGKYFLTFIFAIAALTLSGFGILGNFLRYIPLIPQSIPRLIENYIIYYMQTLCIFFMNGFSSRKVFLYGDSIEDLELCNHITVCNHQGASDLSYTSMIFILMNQKFNIRYSFKETLGFIPLFGPFVSLVNAISLARNNTKKDLNNIEYCIENMLKDNNKFGYVVFAEGTRINPKNPSVQTKSNEFLTKAGYPNTTYTLAPRLRGFKSILSKTTDVFDKIFDITICVYDKTKNMPVNGRCSFFKLIWNSNYEAHYNIRIFNKDEIMQLDTDAKFLYNWFYEKDKFIKQFEKDSNNKPKPTSVLHTPTLLPITIAISFSMFNFIFLFIFGFFNFIYFWTVVNIISYSLLFYRRTKIS